LTDTITHLGWLPEDQDWASVLDQARSADPADAIKSLIALANRRIDFIQTARLDRAVQRLATHARPALNAALPVRLALLGSSTLTHLIPGIRVGALRRGIWVDVYEAPYGMYRQEIQDSSSGLHAFRPDIILLSIDAYHILGAHSANAEDAVNALRDWWRIAIQSFKCTVVQQAVLPIFRPILGNNEHRYPLSPQSFVAKLNARIRDLCDQEGVQILAIDSVAAMDGISEWHDESLWHRSKQEIHPRVSHVYGDQVARLIAAVRGRSYKCLVLDLDNTLWGGVIGDDGLAGIEIGQGSAVGEAYLAFQRYAWRLAQRGVILAVCSKNDEANAIEAFDRHPEMLLRREHIACFVANWNDKATNLRQIAKQLNIGVDSLVFADDNPFERNLIRQELPEVAVPELPDDPALYGACIAAAGYFEGLSITAEDEERTSLYRANAEREQLRESVTDMASYLASLRMELRFGLFGQVDLPRIVQLINKTNQFNLTTRRYAAPEVQAMLNDRTVMPLQFRLVDRFGDNGIIGLVIGKLNDEMNLDLDTWLMSCRVLGRQVEAAMLNVVVNRARQLGAVALVGAYGPTAKNAMVKDHYSKLGFEQTGDINGETTWRLPLESFNEVDVAITIVEGSQ
jgi:FkbH-like protein